MCLWFLIKFEFETGFERNIEYEFSIWLDLVDDLSTSGAGFPRRCRHFRAVNLYILRISDRVIRY